MPFRAPGNNEALYLLDDKTINHGNFLESIIYLSTYDEILRTHLQKAVSLSQKRKNQANATAKKGHQAAGRGSLVTFLSKTFVNRLVLIIHNLIQRAIVREVKHKMFSLQVDSSQDISTVDQAAIVLRYVKESVVIERLVAVLQVKDSTGEGLSDLLQKSFRSLDLTFSRLIGMSFDGASNMRGQFNGLQSKIKSIQPKAVYIWCYAHRLNLCVADCCNIIEAKNFFGFLNWLATFIGESAKRTDVWTDHLKNKYGNARLKKLQKIGETRWWAKDKPLTEMFGDGDNLFLVTIEVLFYIADSGKCDGNISSEAESLYQKLTEFKVILTAHIFLLVFKVIGPVSRYLQTPRLNFKIACDTVRNARVDIDKIEFDLVHEKAKAFVEKANDALSEEEELSDIYIESDLPVKRISRKKRMDGENCFDERPNCPVKFYRFNVFRPIIDQISSSLQERFADENEEMYRACNYFAPSSFAEIRDDPALVYESRNGT